MYISPAPWIVPLTPGHGLAVRRKRLLETVATLHLQIFRRLLLAQPFGLDPNSRKLRDVELFCCRQADTLYQVLANVSETERTLPLQEWQGPTVPEHKPVWALKPLAVVTRHAISYFRDSDDPSSMEFCRIKCMLATGRTVDVERSVNQNRTTVLCRPRPIFNILGAMNYQVSPWLPYRQNLHDRPPKSWSTIFRIVTSL